MARHVRRTFGRRRQSPAVFNKLLWVLAGFGVLLAVASGVAIAAGLYLYDDYADEFVAPAQLAVNQPYDGARIYDRNGEFLYELVDELNGLRRPVDFEAISPNLIAATVATEDATFFQNAGLNMRGLARAAWENFNPFGEAEILTGSGGSSISQQLAKNLYIPEDERTDRTIDRKAREAVYALELTRQYSKEQIITWYLNQISYGGIFYGVEAAAEGYFGKSASDLTLAEAALLAGIPQSPSAYEPIARPEAAKARRNQVLELIRELGVVSIGEGRVMAFTDAQIDAAKAEELNLRSDGFTLTAPHFVFSQVRPQLEALFGRDALYQDGLLVTTTIDMTLQREAEAILERWIQEFEGISNSRNGAVIVIDPGTGEILTYAGSRDFYREDIEGKNDNLLALNSPGSSFKPFVYLTSFLELGWSPGTIIVDQPTQFREDDGTVFQPENPTDRYHGRITIRDALGNSLNVPPFRTAMAVGVDKIVEHARRFGFSTLDSQYGPSIAIGGVDLTAMDLAYGYAMLANGGVVRGIALNPEAPDELSPAAVLSVRDRSGREIYNSRNNLAEKRVVDEEHAFMITSILTDPRAQCVTFGCGGVTVPGRTVAVKTGTSEPFDPQGENAGKIGDTWAFGYTRDYVVGIWAGNSDNAAITNIFSTSISFRSMRDIMLRTYGDQPQTPFEQPPGLTLGSNCSTREIGVGCNRDLVLQPRNDNPGPVAQDAPGDDRDPNQRDEDDQDEREDDRDAEREPTPERAPASTQPATGGSILASIATPSGGVASGNSVVQGAARSPSLTSYSLEVQGPGGAWQSVGGGSQAVTGTLGVLSGLAPGTYTLRLTVTDAALGTASDSVTFTIQ
jgi:membrane peptidoglycan carboxypeptidase